MHTTQVVLQQPQVLTSAEEKVTAVGFEPTPFRTGALSQRLRPLGQTVLGMPCARREKPPAQAGKHVGWRHVRDGA